MKQTHKPGFTLLEVIIVLAIVAVLGGAAYYQYHSSDTETTSSTPTPTPTATPVASATPTATPDQTANWKTSSSKLFGWSMKYPENWYVSTSYTENDFTKRGGNDVGIDYIGGDTTWANYDLNKLTSLQDTPDTSESVSMMVYRKENTTIEQFEESRALSIHSKTNVKSGDVEGIQYVTGGNNSGETTFDTGITTIFKKGTSIYVIGYGKMSGLDSATLATYKTMLASLTSTK